MINEPKCGWCNFKLGSFIGRPSGYMTTVITGEVNPVSYVHCAISFKSKFNID